MSHRRNRAIVATSKCRDEIVEAYERAVEIIRSAWPSNEDLHAFISPLSAPAWNGQRTFVVLPDGTDPGSDVSVDLHWCRSEIVMMLAATRVDWVEVQIGEEQWPPTYITHDAARRRMLTAG